MDESATIGILLLSLLLIFFALAPKIIEGKYRNFSTENPYLKVSIQGEEQFNLYPNEVLVLEPGQEARLTGSTNRYNNCIPIYVLTESSEIVVRNGTSNLCNRQEGTIVFAEKPVTATLSVYSNNGLNNFIMFGKIVVKE